MVKGAMARIAREKMRLAVSVLCYQVLYEYHVAVYRVSLKRGVPVHSVSLGRFPGKLTLLFFFFVMERFHRCLK